MEGKILAAVSRMESAEYVSLYSVMLAKRTGMDACVLMVISDGIGRGHVDGSDHINEKVRKIKETGEAAGVNVDCLVTDGVFEHEVASHLKLLGSSILVVGEGRDIAKRREELRSIEQELMEAGGWGRDHPHQFLIVSKKFGADSGHNNHRPGKALKKKSQGGVS